MNITSLFETYEILITDKLWSKDVFTSSGMVNTYKLLDYGFFPLGSGILADNKCKIDIASIDEGGLMVLGNDFGTVTYIETKCKNKRENNSKTINNLLGKDNGIGIGIGLNTNKTFFTNFYLGLRDDKSHQGTTMTKRIKNLEQDYKDLCKDFFIIQLEKINPKTIICLGVEVGQTLSEYFDLFKTFAKKYSTITNLYAYDSKTEYIINIEDDSLGQRKFILIPHPSYAHINWVKNDIKRKIIKAINY